VLWYLSDAENWEKAFDTVYDLADTAYDTVAYADHTEAAQVEGMIAFEVVLEILTSGFGAARHVDKIDDIADGAKVIGNVMENLEDSGKLAENLKQLAADDVPKIDDIPNGPAGETLTGQADEVPPIYATPVPGSPADEARKANPYEETKIDEIRDEHGIGRKKNVAYVEGVIDGNSVDIQSHSGQKSKPGTVEAKPFEEQQLDTSPTERDVEKGQTADDRRAYDSEVKAMEEILDNTTPESTGKIKIVTERNLCDSCANAVEQFRELRPNIEVETVYSIPYNN